MVINKNLIENNNKSLKFHITDIDLALIEKKNFH